MFEGAGVRIARTIVGLLALAGALAVAAETMGGKDAAPAVIVSSGPLVSSAAPVVREINDPALGVLWLLIKDPQHSGGPGKFVMVDKTKGLRSADASALQGIEQALPVIHAGERVVVEEHSAVVDARLEGTALEPALQGAPLRVRLKLSGQVVHAIAQASGRALLAPEGEAER